MNRVTAHFRYSLDSNGNVEIGILFPRLDERWIALGDALVPVTEGARAGFEAHDVMHVAMLCETNWSPVLGILLGGDRNGVFGGPPALGEEGLVMWWYMKQRFEANTAIGFSDGGMRDRAAIRRAYDRGMRAVEHILNCLGQGLAGTVEVDDFPEHMALRTRARALSGDIRTMQHWMTG